MSLHDRTASLADAPASRLLAIGLIVGVVVAVVLAIVVLDRPSTSFALQRDPVTVKRALSTTAALFGDPVQAEIDVYTNDRVVSASSLQVRTDFRPYRVVATTTTHASHGGVSLLRTKVSLQCLTRDCLPPRSGTGTVTFRPFLVSYEAHGQSAHARVPWETLQVSTRLPRDPSARVGIVDAPPMLDAQFRHSPELLRLLFLLAAAVLAIVGVALIVPVLWPRSFLARRRWRRLSPLERSLLEVEAAAQNQGEAVRRQTLDHLATRLGEVPSRSLEAKTRALAWGETAPEPEALTLLAAQVRTTLNGGVRS